MYDTICKLFHLSFQKSRQITQTMIVIFIFSVLFPNEVLKVINILFSKIQLIMPSSFTELLFKLQFTKEDFCTVYGFLLSLYAIAAFLDVLNQFLLGYIRFIIHSAGTILFDINAIILLFVLIYNTTHIPGIGLTSAVPKSPYFFFVVISTYFFLISFALTFCNPFRLIWLRINNPDTPKKQKLFFNIIFWIVICILIIKILDIFFR